MVQLCKTGLEPSLSFQNISSFECKLRTVSSQHCHQVLHGYMGFVPIVMQACDVESSLVAGTILTIARLDVLIWTILFYFSNNCLYKVSGHLQNHYHDTFKSFLPVGFSHFNAGMVTFVKEQCLEEVVISLTGIYKTETCVSLMNRCEGSVAVYRSPLQRNLIAVSWKWSSQYIPMELGAIHNCHNAEYDNSKKKVMFFGSLHTDNKHLFERFE